MSSAAAIAAFLATPVKDLDLSVRSSKSLTRDPFKDKYGVDRGGFGPDCIVHDIVTQTDARLLKIYNFGRKSLSEVKEVLAPWDLRLDMTEEQLTELCGKQVEHGVLQVFNRWNQEALAPWFGDAAQLPSNLILELEGSLGIPTRYISVQDLADAIAQKSPFSVKLRATLELYVDANTKTSVLKILIK